MRLSTLILSGLLPASLAASLPSYGPSKVSWNDCPSHLNPNASAHLHCGYLDVPLDWDEPSKHEPVKIGFVKIPARDPKVSSHKCDVRCEDTVERIPEMPELFSSFDMKADERYANKPRIESAACSTIQADRAIKQVKSSHQRYLAQDQNYIQRYGIDSMVRSLLNTVPIQSETSTDHTQQLQLSAWIFEALVSATRSIVIGRYTILDCRSTHRTRYRTRR